MLECVFINVKKLKSKAGNDFNLASFVLDGDLFKIVVSNDVCSHLQNFSSGDKVLCDFSISVWSEKLSVSISSVELAS